MESQNVRRTWSYLRMIVFFFLTIRAALSPLGRMLDNEKVKRNEVQKTSIGGRASLLHEYSWQESVHPENGKSEEENILIRQENDRNELVTRNMFYYSNGGEWEKQNCLPELDSVAVPCAW